MLLAGCGLREPRPIVTRMRNFILALILAIAVPAATAKTIEKLSIETASGTQNFTVEVVREEKERTRGLMFRRKMKKTRGMLFDYDPPLRMAFWMKNTYISLDIIFIGADGRIINIAERTTPLSLEQLPAKGPARGVLEINGGLSAKLGIKPGDKVHHALFEPKK